MEKITKEVLCKIEKAGFKAYVVGGYVRDLLQGIRSNDLDICTDALPKDIKEIFNVNCESNEYGSINFKISDYNFDITTFRKETKYFNRKPTEIEYIKDLNIDILRRDFTVNALCMNKNGKIIDLLEIKKDLKNRVIKLIGNNERLKEDPLRILRAIRFATILDFEIDEKLCDGIIMYKELIKDLSSLRIKNELDKIFLSKNFKLGLEYLKKFDLLDYLGINFNKVVYVEDLSGMWAQIEISKEFPFTKEEKTNILKIKEILTQGKLDNFILYKYGLYITSVTAKIFNYDVNEIVEKYENLPINSRKDLNITFNQLKELIRDEGFEKTKKLEAEIIKKVLNYELDNTNDDIVKYIKRGMI